MVDEIKKDLSELEKLKAQNDEFEKELIRSREMRAEQQKIEAEKLLSSTAGVKIEPQTIDPAKQMADEIIKAFH